ncbi:hypothetical protein [Paraburkholderia sp. BL25I1N1]|uniref:hypothetical protein n=1 Tax=Paraburkholderia sp. BL25I1N1 TaxID=1938804 RepID=UPI000D05DF6F|nr:hypothetical protein [Paraburkholderia sp. BL25I1N1]PRX96409.1 hypothetical protein B0G73_13028 [Paraburkholderia sp. BL25I1N1]
MKNRWISRRIKKLDAEDDYDEIWKLMTAYRANDFIMNFIYVVTFPHFFVREHDARPLIDDGNGKILINGDRRADDTSWKMQVWWHYGSDHEKTRKNVESINRIHEAYAKRFPDSFGHLESYLYTLCYEAAGMHRLMRRVGMRGFSAKEQRVAVKYWSTMAVLFRNAQTGERISGFPGTFDGIMRFMDTYELDGMTEPSHEMGRIAARAILDQFAQRYFPRWLHGLAHAWIISLYPGNVLKAYELKPLPRAVVKLFRLGTAAFLWYGERIVPDPIDTFTERREAKLARRKASVVTTETSHDAAQPEHETALRAGCPHFRGGTEHTDRSVSGKTGA